MEPPFTINLNDPADVVVKHGEAVVILQAKQQKLAGVREIEREVAKWQSTVDFLASQLPDPAIAPASGAPVTATAENGNGRGEMEPRPGDLAVAVVNREVRKIRSIEVRDIIADEGIELTPQVVSNALHYAANVGRKIKVVARGMYAPLAYEENDTDETVSPAALTPGQPAGLQGTVYVRHATPNPGGTRGS